MAENSWRKAIYEIYQRDQPKIEVSGWVRGGLGIHHEHDDTWVIDHLGTGLAVMQVWGDGLEYATQFADELLALCDWTFTESPAAEVLEQMYPSVKSVRQKMEDMYSKGLSAPDAGERRNIDAPPA